MSPPDLNPQQLTAVNHQAGPLLVLAGAGSGKTRVITHRIARLVSEAAVPPEEILAVTFTNKAAGEMKERLARMLGAKGHRLAVGTFHSICLQILRQSADRIGYSKSFVIYDSDDSLALVRDCLKDLQLDDKRFHPKAVDSRIDAAKNALIWPEAYAADAADFYATKVAQVYLLYQKRLKEYNAMDFGDLIGLAVRLFESAPAVLAHYQSRFRHLLVDEYQDTNHAQYRLVRHLSPRGENLCVVGDEDQSIYRWRGADLNNVLNFEKDFPGARIIKLEQNYRSTQTIVEAACALIAHNTLRKGKKLWSDAVRGEPIGRLEARHEKEEAAWIVGNLLLLKNKAKLVWKEAAIFYRTNAQSRLFEDELRRFKIPYRVFGGVRFYDRMEIKDLLAYLKFIANDADPLSLKRAIANPGRGIGKTSLEKMETWAQGEGVTLWQALQSEACLKSIGSGVAKKVRGFVRLISRLKKEEKLKPLPAFIQSVLELSGYFDDLKRQGTSESEDRLENLGEFVNLAAEFVQAEPEAGLAGFLDRLALVQDTDAYNPEEGAVSLMTVHLAKGLEFPYVFVAGLEEGLFPHSRSTEDPEELEEERRLMYVAMTRAKTRLFLSSSMVRKQFGSERYNIPSRFLDEIPPQFFQPAAGTITRSSSVSAHETRIVWDE